MLAFFLHTIYSIAHCCITDNQQKQTFVSIQNNRETISCPDQAPNLLYMGFNRPRNIMTKFLKSNCDVTIMKIN